MSAGYWRAAVVVGVALALWAAFEWGVPRQGSLVALPPLPALHPNQRLAQAQHLFPNDWIGSTPSPFFCLVPSPSPPVAQARSRLPSTSTTACTLVRALSFQPGRG